jgi:hypothetical protein
MHLFQLHEKVTKLSRDSKDKVILKMTEEFITTKVIDAHRGGEGGGGGHLMYPL